jgi:hypothetical protein
MVLDQALTQKVVTSPKEIQEQKFMLKLDLLRAVPDYAYVPEGDCPAFDCGRKMTPIEIIKGFNQDPTDFTTCCPKCGHRFRPSLVARSAQDGSIVRTSFYCSTQTLSLLQGKEYLSPEDLEQDHQGVYRSAIAHFGGLRQAFAKNGVSYHYQETIPDWREKVRPCLGMMKDTEIARIFIVSVYSVRKLRKELKIPRCINSEVWYERV